MAVVMSAFVVLGELWGAYVGVVDGSLGGGSNPRDPFLEVGAYVSLLSSVLPLHT